jgi:hypothetical protein
MIHLIQSRLGANPTYTTLGICRCAPLGQAAASPLETG